METKFTSARWITAILLIALLIFISAEISLQAPFYQAEAQRKGASATEYRFVFASVQIVNFVTCPLVGKIVKTYGLRRLIAGGTIISSIALILFGFLNRVENKNLFIGLSIILNVIEAIGASFANTAGYALIGIFFPDKKATVISTIPIFSGVGLILGSSVQGLVFKFSGFSFPFISGGILGFIVFFLTLLLIPRTTDCSSKENETNEIFSVLKIPGVLVYSICQVLSSASETFYLTLLTTHLGQFNLPPEVTSLFFVIITAVYMIVSPFFGRALDSGAVKPSTLIICASILAVTSFTLIGPAPYLRFRLTIPICMIALATLGLWLGASNTASYMGKLESARNAGFTDGTGLIGLISGIWIGATSLGGFIGPIIAGILYDHYGFRWATQFFVAAFIIQLIGMIIFERITKRNNYNDYNLPISGINESTPILKNTSYQDKIKIPHCWRGYPMRT